MPPILLKNKRFTPNHMFNACTFCITAAAGTKLAGASSLNLIIILFSEKGLRPIEFHNLFEPTSPTRSRWIRLSPIVQNSLLQAKSLGLLSVPVWLSILSDQLRINALVSLYLTNKLILYKPILKRR